MAKLITIELKKILCKKSLFVVLGLMVIFCFLNNILYWTDYDEDGNYKYETKENLQEEKENLETELAKYSSTKESDFSMYLSLKTKLDIIKLKEQYPSDSWQYKKINDYFYDLLYQVNLYTDVEKNTNLLKEVTEEYQKKLTRLTQNDWKYFVNEEIKNIKEENDKLKENLESIVDKKAKQELEETISENSEKLKILEYRLTKNIKEDNSYLNRALTSYQEYSKTVRYYQNLKTKLSLEEKQEYLKAQSEVLISQYIIEQQVNINKQNNLNYQLRTIVEDYEIFFIMIILMVASAIVCEEFQTGTIKLLLIKPYSRGKILLSKYFTTILVLLFSILFLIGIQFLFGTVFFGTESLKLPVVVYHYNTASVESYSVFWYMLIRILVSLPMLLILLTLCFTIGVISMNTIVSISIPLLLYMFSIPIHNLAIQYNLKWMRFLINMNWDFKTYLFGRFSDFAYVNFNFSLFIWSIYLITLIVIAFVNFKKKNIKNI